MIDMTVIDEIFKSEHEEVCEKLDDIYKKLDEVLDMVKPKIIYVPQPYPVYVELTPWWEDWRNTYAFPVDSTTMRYGCDVLTS